MTSPTRIEILTPFKRYPSIGHCIYCPVYSKNVGKEHIIPFGIGADSLVLPRASCTACSDATKKFETICQRHMWWPFRTRIGAPSRSKVTPKTFEVRQINVNSVQADGTLAYDRAGKIEVEADRFPFSFYTYQFQRAKILSGDISETFVYNAWCKIDREDFKKFAPNDKDGFRLGPESPIPFLQLIAKIAHSYAIAEFGSNSFKPMLHTFIRSKEIHGFNFVGGTEPRQQAEPDNLHELEIHTQEISGVVYLVVYVRLFSFLGTPAYEAVVGTVNDGQQIETLQKPLYAIKINSPFPLIEGAPIVSPPVTWTHGG